MPVDLSVARPRRARSAPLSSNTLLLIGLLVAAVILLGLPVPSTDGTATLMLAGP